MKIIAYYLPQFHPIPENDNWWGKGFTEWTNVAKARKLYCGHYQPKIPADLSFYDLRLSSVREEQANLAKEAGVYGFCYWHYWFGNGKQLLEKPFNDVLKLKKPDFPFSLGWANESWKSKVWSSADGKKDKILIKQEYPGTEDIEKHFYTILPALKDKRYITHEGKPLFVIYKPFQLKNSSQFLDTWNKLAKKNGFESGFYFVGHTLNDKEVDGILNLGFDAVNVVRIGEYKFNKKVIIRNILPILKFKILNRPLVLKYSNLYKYFTSYKDLSEVIIPSIIPNWDHTPRSGNNGVVYHNSTPKLFKNHVKMVNSVVKGKNNKLVFLKSWNEWGEGNYMEPDLKFGQGYIKALSNIIR